MAENDKHDDVLRRIAEQSQEKPNSHTRNAILVFGGIVLLLLLALIFFRQKEISFDPVKTSSGSGLVKKVIFTELKQQELGLTASDQKRLERLLDYVGDRFKQIQVWVEKDNKYDKLEPNTEMRFQITLVTHDGARIRSVVHRTKHGRLVDAIAQRIERDVEAYLRTEPGKNPPGSFTNVN